MKLIKRLTTVIMIIALLALPVASFADGMSSFSIGNFAVNALGMEMNIGATIDVEYGKLDGRELVKLTLLGGEDGKTEAGVARVIIDETGLKASLDGIANSYGITTEEMEAIMAQAMESSGASSPVDTKVMQDMVNAYINMLTMQKDKAAYKEYQKNLNEKIMAYFGDRAVITAEESYDVFGYETTGERIKFTLTADDMDAIIEIMEDNDDNLKVFLDNYFKLLSTISAEGEISEFSSFKELYGSMGMTFTCDIDMLKDAEGKATKVDMNYNMGDGTTTVEMPMHMDVLDDGNMQKVAVVIDTVIEEVPMFISMDVTDMLNGNTTMKCVMDMGPDGEKVYVDMEMATTLDGDKEGAAMTLKTLLNDEELMTGSFDYDGTVSGEGDMKSHEGRFSLNAYIMNYGEFSFAADVKFANEEMTAADFEAVDALPMVKFSELDEEKVQAITEELQVVGIQALGVMASTPGVAELISMAMSVAEPTDVSEYGYEEFDDYEEFEDFENWEEIESDAEVEA